MKLFKLTVGDSDTSFVYAAKDETDLLKVISSGNSWHASMLLNCYGKLNIYVTVVELELVRGHMFTVNND